MENLAIKKSNKHFHQWLWDAWCIFSVVGIWPRFIEPNLVEVSHVDVAIPHLPLALDGLKIVQFSDLHLNKSVSSFFLKKVIRKINQLNPDLLFFTGDFLCKSVLDDQQRMKNFFNSLNACYGCYAIFGNHDYEKCISINHEGDYDVVESIQSNLIRGFQRLLNDVPVTGTIVERAKKVELHPELLTVLQETSFKTLHNETEQVQIGDSFLNICGLGEYMAGRCLPEIAFKNYDKQYPGIILAHNPDSSALLESYPGEVILSGHTHGCQINLPWMWKKFTKLENMSLRKGFFKVRDKWLYVNRGVGAIMKFRWFSVPEVLFLTLRKKS
ncbi:uncharacterized metaLLophosphoesterase TC_0746 [Parachlamydia acanthamoebae UV-7]|uniref:Uncharacterized metaLLophosphoesterase TC_0746 n=2 Tax=Parachlamydia acanthamoebae TaxID=83552 RepID=F8KVL0_PARAV|nr:UDP-2,3-diacylglucosamine diphosphatase LpxG [Parachlamydia acanthamoebae]KIA76349.1 putative metallophosphoesterase [Parachlamydia acanthamoebae]CCB85146.1 uncharacterized metaLLophosphoesterase TC_0746 [Parachlamydia acanthamoebae UV-7]